MSEIDDLFDKAYGLHEVEDKQSEAIQLCRRILELDPNHNWARMLLGVILGDYGETEAELSESREQFMEVLKRTSNLSEMARYSWSEENPIYQLGIWEWNRGNLLDALILFVIEYCIDSRDWSLDPIREILKELNVKNFELIEYLLKRIGDERKSDKEGVNEKGKGGRSQKEHRGIRGRNRGQTERKE